MLLFEVVVEKEGAIDHLSKIFFADDHAVEVGLKDIIPRWRSGLVWSDAEGFFVGG